MKINLLKYGDWGTVKQMDKKDLFTEDIFKYMMNGRKFKFVDYLFNHLKLKDTLRFIFCCWNFVEKAFFGSKKRILVTIIHEHVQVIKKQSLQINQVLF
jgi:hypothetical protein